jgi:hypothetical protein
MTNYDPIYQPLNDNPRLLDVKFVAEMVDFFRDFTSRRVADGSIKPKRPTQRIEF